ncbi:STAS domain-containing protein [Streptomyces sp. NPDC002845]
MPPEAHDPTADSPWGTAAGSGLAAPNPYTRGRRTGPFLVVQVHGEIDMATAACVAEHLETATNGPSPDVLVNLRRCAFLDCSAARAVPCRGEGPGAGGRLRLVSDQPRIRRLLRAAGLLNRFPPLPEPPPPPRPGNGSAPRRPP